MVHAVNVFIGKYYDIIFQFANRKDPQLTFNFGEFISFDYVKIDWLFKFDNLSILMCLVILAVSGCVQLFSYDYMRNDAHAIRFFAFLSLFTFSMIMLVTSNNLAVFYIG
jgi:NADH-quinone oxidoreductase subunit L